MGFLSSIKSVIKKVETVIQKVDLVGQRLKLIQSMNFGFGAGGRVASTQDAYFKVYLDSKGKPEPNYASRAISTLTADPWVIIASKVSPGNLVVRQWALIDLFRGEAQSVVKIQNMISLVSYGNMIWAEGYSYWQYTKAILDIWVERFKNTTNLNNIVSIMTQIDSNFVQTAYKKGNVWYPAPFGDLYLVPLESKLQVNHNLQSRTVSIVNMVVAGTKVTYGVTGRPIGLNVHIPVDNSIVVVNNGQASGFKFYTGYGNKYQNNFAETADVLNLKRIESTLNLW